MAYKNAIDGSRTSAQLCNKVPIGYSGTPQIHPKTAFPLQW